VGTFLKAKGSAKLKEKTDKKFLLKALQSENSEVGEAFKIKKAVLHINCEGYYPTGVSLIFWECMSDNLARYLAEPLRLQTDDNTVEIAPKSLITETQLICAMKEDITQLMTNNVIPHSICSFDEIHQYCDEGTIGVPQNIWEELEKQFFIKDEGEISDEMWNFLDGCQRNVSVWLAAGRKNMASTSEP
jgi:hypothetical protein